MTRYSNSQLYPPGMLLKIILCAYAEGVVSSRGIERLCREHVSFIALSGDSASHFTTIAILILRNIKSPHCLQGAKNGTVITKCTIISNR